MKRLGWLLFALLIIYFIFLIRQDIMDNLGLKQELAEVQANILREHELAGKFKQKIQDLKKPWYLEELARVRLGLVKLGETAYKVIKQPDGRR